MPKDFITFNHGKNPIDLSKYGSILVELRPIELHHKEDGSLKGEPSFAIVMSAFGQRPVVGQISLEMLNEGLNELGYEIIKKHGK